MIPFRSAFLALVGLSFAGPALADPLAPLDDSQTIVVVAPRNTPTSPDVLGTAAIDAGVTIYDARFRRVSAADRAHPAVQAIAAQLAGLSPVDQLYRVKVEVARRVRLASDSDTMHVADYWSNAGDTLARGAGDDEDIAIVEMQALKAAGFNPADLFISIGRHRRHGLHTVLIARASGSFYLLDDQELQPVRASGMRAASFTPMMTIGFGKSYLHGYRRATRIAARQGI